MLAWPHSGFNAHDGVGTVYLSEDLKHKRKVALKVLTPGLAAAEPFLHAIKVTANFQHPEIHCSAAWLSAA